MTTQNNQATQHTPSAIKGCWIIPKNLPISHSVQDMGALISDSEEFSKACEQSLTANEMPSPHQIWSRKLKKVGWMQLLSGRILRISHTKAFMDLWTSYLGESHANHFPLQESEREKKAKSFYIRHFQGALESASQESSSSKMSKAYDLLDLITPCQSPTSISIEQIPSYYTFSETWKIWDILAIFDLKLRAERVFPIQGGVFLLGQSEMIARLKKFKSSLLLQTNSQSKKVPTQKEQDSTHGKALDLWMFSQQPNQDQYLSVEDAERLLEKHYELHGGFSGLDVNVVPNIDPESYDTDMGDALRSIELETHVGKVRVYQHKIGSRYLYRNHRAALHGNGVVPQMCSLAVFDVLQSILNGKLETEYLPKGFNNVDRLEQAIADGRVSFSKIKNNKEYYKDKKQIDALIPTLWPTPLKRDEKDYTNRKITKDRIKPNAVTISRAHEKLYSQVFYQYYVQHDLIPKPFEGLYVDTKYNPNPNWAESLMGLQAGWTHPLFGWDLGSLLGDQKEDVDTQDTTDVRDTVEEESGIENDET